jgi:Skp family chaperone for outer membrane proteins
MFKRILIITGVVTLSVIMSGSVCSAASMVKIGVVDLQKALNATSEGIAAKERLRKKHEAKQGQVDAKKEELDSLEERIKSPVLSEEARDQLEKEYMKKRTDLIEFVQVAKEEEEKENQQLSTQILEGLVKIAREIAEKGKYTVILEKTGAGVVYFEPDMDLTEEITKIYNERFQGEPGK